MLFLIPLFTQILMSAAALRPPNIIFILADDLGFNDLSFRGSDLIPTPNIDALAYSGRILNRHYVMPICTPSRSALLSGVHPILLGTQGDPLRAGQRGGIPLSVKLVPEKLQNLGYRTHMTGKWHVGFQSSEYLPTRRGFESFLGYYNGYIDYYHLSLNQSLNESDENGKTFAGYDMHDGLQPRWDLQGQYATQVFTQRAVEVIQNHDSSSPLFLLVSHLAAHTGTVEGDGLQAPPGVARAIKAPLMLPSLSDGVVQALDESVGEVVEALAKANMLNDSVILFLSDNGASSVSSDMQPNFGSNWPLRGVKFSLYEGGVRGGAVIWGVNIPGQVIDDQAIHMTDWGDLLVLLAGGEPKSQETSQIFRNVFTERSSTTPRDFLLSIDELEDSEAVVLDSRWKVVKQNMREYANYEKHVQVQGNGKEVPPVTSESVRSSKTGKALKDLGVLASDSAMESLRIQAEVRCRPEATITMGRVQPSTDFFCKTYCVFDLLEDPCELRPLNKPEILSRGIELLNSYRKSVVPQNRNPVDVLSDPDRFGGVWSPWLDKVETNHFSSGQEGIVCMTVLLLLLVTGLLVKHN